ncbi:streptophobe family protein [Streptomyces sp. R21]|uniref:Streptophobe family protein n=1 Tax=Streptomyces sp. R21 TaxID=3238627 RepID=A0AB39PGF7_9ACTN
MSIDRADHGRRVPWGDVLVSAIASVSWALIGMAGVAALGLHLLEADTAGSLGPMTAAVVALGAGGSVTPAGDVSAFGLKGAEAHTAIQITPLGVGLVGALLLSWFFLRSLRGAGVVIALPELVTRAVAVVVLFVATLGGLAWAGHDIITIDGGKLGLDKAGGGLGDITDKLPGGLGNIGGLLPDKIGDLVNAKAAVGFTVDTVPTLLGGAAWAAGVLVIALLASRRTPLPRGWEAVHRVVRPAASALVAVLLVAVAAGFAAAAYAAIGDAHPKRIAGAALLGAPNGVWLGIPIGLFVPWDGKATGELAKLLPDPLDKLLSIDSDRPVTVGRLAELDNRVWLLAVATAVMMLFAGVLTAARTPFVRSEGGAALAGDPGAANVRRGGVLGFAGRCALPLGIVTALALPLLAWLTDVSANASLSVLGFDAFGAGIELHGHPGMALVLGAAWGAGAGAAGALLACASGAAGRRAAPLARGDAAAAGPVAAELDLVHPSGPYNPATPFRPANPDTNPYLRLPDELREPDNRRPPGTRGPRGARQSGAPGGTWPSGSGRPPGNVRPPDPTRSPEGPRPPDNVYGAPTVVGPIAPPPRPPKQRGSRSGSVPPPPPPPPSSSPPSSSSSSEEGPPPPPPGRPRRRD